jgi:hypothetical protein
MNRTLVLAILCIVNAVPVAYFGIKTYDFIHPNVVHPFILANYRVMHSSLDAEIEQVKIQIFILADKIATTNSVSERAVQRKRFEQKQKELKEAEERKKAEERLQAEQRERQRELDDREYALRQKKLEQERRERDVELAAGVVAFIFLLTLGVLWILSKLGGPVEAGVKAVIASFGGKLWITAVGIVGAFLAIAMVGVGAVYLLARIQV